MGRPLYSSIFSEATIVHVAQVHDIPSYEKWSVCNAFDPDSDEFFEGENVQYEAFLTPEQVAEQQRERESMERTDLLTTEFLSRSSDVPYFANMERERRTSSGDVPLPDLEPALSDESASEDSGSGRSSPAAETPMAVPMSRSDAMDAADERVPYPVSIPILYHVSDDEYRPPPWLRPGSPSSASIMRQLQAERQREPSSRERDNDVDMDSMPPLVSPISSPISIPATPRPAHSPPALAYSPLSPPPSVTPRFMSWGPHPPIGRSNVPDSPSPLAPVRSIHYLPPMRYSRPTVVAPLRAQH